MIRGTTPLHEFDIGIPTDMIDKVRVLYSQADKLILTKDTEQCKLEGTVVKVKLTQQDTLAFDCNFPVEIQLRALSTDGEAMACKPFKVSVSKCLENEVLE